jgi:hypothetical protein
MSIAKGVVDADRQGIDWLTIEDADGGRWRYGKRGVPLFATPIHVQAENSSFHFHREADGKPTLRQQAAGLPSKIIVRIANTTTVPLGSWSSWAGGGGIFQYEQEPGP